MSYIFLFLAGCLALNMLIGVVNEKRKPSGQPKEDLRLAYAPDLTQAILVYGENDYLEEKRRIREPWDRYHRELQDAKIKRWLEGNPVTDENPLKGKEVPIPLYSPSPD